MKAESMYQYIEICLQHIQAGAELEEVLTLFPEWADDLRPEVEAAIQLRDFGSSIDVPNAGKMRSRALFLDTAQTYAAGQGSKGGGFFAFLSPARLSLAALVVVLAVLFGAAGTFAVSARALPGDTLYTVKLATERTRMMLATQPDQRLELQKSFDRERLEEIRRLQAGAVTRWVNFAGALSEIDGDVWRVEDLRIHITPETHMEAGVEAGYHVEVSGLLLPDGSIQAERVQLRRMVFTGELKYDGDRWMVDGVTVQFPGDLSDPAQLIPGSEVRVEVVQQNDESLEAVSIQVLRSPAGAPPVETLPLLQPDATEAPTPQPSPPVKTDDHDDDRDDDLDDDRDDRDGDDDRGDDMDDDPGDDRDDDRDDDMDDDPGDDRDDDRDDDMDDDPGDDRDDDQDDDMDDDPGDDRNDDGDDDNDDRGSVDDDDDHDDDDDDADDDADDDDDDD